MMSTTLPLSESYGTLSFREAGRGKPVVLIHGVGMQSAAWRPQIEVLSDEYRIIALDMPGHGGSSPLSKGAMLPEYVEWLKAALKVLDLGRIRLVGHSMGALVAAGYAVTYPADIAGVALLNGVYCRSAKARAAVEARADQIRCGSFDLETPLKRWFGETSKEKAVREGVREWLSQVDPHGYATAYSAFARGDQTYADRFGDITCPFLAITGDEDLNSTPAMSKAMADAVPVGQSVVIAGHRHLVNLTASDQVNMVLRDWLGREAENDRI